MFERLLNALLRQINERTILRILEHLLELWKEHAQGTESEIDDFLVDIFYSAILRTDDDMSEESNGAGK